ASSNVATTSRSRTATSGSWNRTQPRRAPPTPSPGSPTPNDRTHSDGSRTRTTPGNPRRTAHRTGAGTDARWAIIDCRGGWGERGGGDGGARGGVARRGEPLEDHRGLARDGGQDPAAPAGPEERKRDRGVAPQKGPHLPSRPHEELSRARPRLAGPAHDGNV